MRAAIVHGHERPKRRNDQTATPIESPSQPQSTTTPGNSERPATRGSVKGG